MSAKAAKSIEYIFKNFFFFIQSVVHFDKKLQSPGTILLVCQRINQQKSDQNLIRYKNISFEYYLLLHFFYCKIICSGW